MDSNVSTRPARRKSFSLRTLLFLTTIIALAITTYSLYSKVGPLQVENKRLNEERGSLKIDDPTRACAIRVPDRFAGANRQAFRVYVPPNQEYMAILKINDIPKDDYPDIGTLPDRMFTLGGTRGLLFGVLESGEKTIALETVTRGSRQDYVLRKGGPDLDAMFLHVSANSPEDKWPTVRPDTYSVFGDRVEKERTPVDDSGRLVLIRTRIQGVTSESLNHSYVTPEPQQNLDGVMLWLVRIK